MQLCSLPLRSINFTSRDELPINPQIGSTAVTVTLHTFPLGSHPLQESWFTSVLMLFPMLLQFPQESPVTDVE